MTSKPRISDHDTILKRIPPLPDNTKLRGETLTATSFAIRPKEGEYPSWSLERITPADALLNIEKRKGRDMAGWRVAAVLVSQVRELGLDVVPDPTDDDAGHCLIKPIRGEEFPDKVWSRLSKETRIVYTRTR